MKNLKIIKGDASFRKFYRKISKDYTSIIVFSKKDKFKNLLVYDAINKVLKRNKILAPDLYHESYNKDYIEIQDFGNDTLYKILNKKKNKFYYFKKIIKILNQIQLIKNRNIKNFKKKKYIIPKYDKKIIIKEANLFCEWYVKNNLSKNNRNKFIKKFKKVIRKLTLGLKLKNNIFN